MKDKLIVKKNETIWKRCFHWINYDYVIINDELEKCYKKIDNLIEAELKNGSKDYDLNFIRNHIDKLTS